MKAAFPILLIALCEPAKALSLSGVVRRLKQEIPHARITLVTTQTSAELFQDDGLIDECLALEGAIFNLKSLGALTELSRRQWGLVVDIGPTLISRMMPARTRFTYSPNEPGGPLQQICAALNLKPEEVKPSLTVSPAREAQTRTFLDETRETHPIIVMAPGAEWLGRKWPTERYAVLATRLMRDAGPFPDGRLIILGTQADHDIAVALRMATPRAQVMEMTGKLDLLSAYAMLKHAALFIGNDEVWLHLAAAAGAPAFGLLGPSDEANAPIGKNVHVIRGPRSFADIQAIDPKLKHQACHMLDLSIDRVYEGIIAGLDGKTLAPAAPAEEAEMPDLRVRQVV